MRPFLLSSFLLLSLPQVIFSHCQMPCGIYHDDLVYDQIDQYVETMVRGIHVLGENKFQNAKERNEAIRWVMLKDKESDDAARLILTYFLQQKIKPGEEDTTQKVVAAHRLLFQLVAIKQNTDMKLVEQFQKEWENFKLMFHREGYECKMEQKELKQWEEKKKASKEKANTRMPNSHSHEH